MTIAPVESRLREAVDALPKGLREHVLRVEIECVRMAQLHDVDVERAKLAALGHDLVRHKKGDELIAMATVYGLTIDVVEEESPILLHGPIAARIIETFYEVTDEEIIAGIDCHTTARPGMSKLEQVLFVADKIEPHKLESHAAYAEVYDLALTDLDAAVLRYLELNLEESIRRHWLVHERSHLTRNELLLLMKSRAAV